jgi:hypothetical protein
LVAPNCRDGVRYNGKYQVKFRGEILVQGSHDPELDAARSLKARGFSGPVTFVDASTARPRITIRNIERAADLCTKEGPLRFAKVSRAVDADALKEIENLAEWHPDRGGAEC